MKKEIAVIFDMDGVICNTNPFHAKAFHAFFDKYGISASEEEFQEHMYGKHNSYILKHFFKKDFTTEEIIKLEEEKESLFREIYKGNIEPLPGYMEFLSTLKSKGIKTAIATSAPQKNLELIAAELDLAPKMQSILYSEKITKHKPDPEIYLKTAENLGVAPKNCLVFEDSHSGASAGLNAGMKVIGVLSTHTKDQLPKCHYYINDFTEASWQLVQQVLEINN